MNNLKLKNMIEIYFEYNGNKLLLVYSVNEILEHIINTENNKKMMIEVNQIGRGYEMTRNSSFISMDMCNAVYVRIMEIDIFVPKFIFIPNNKSEVVYL